MGAALDSGGISSHRGEQKPEPAPERIVRFAQKENPRSWNRDLGHPGL